MARNNDGPPDDGWDDYEPTDADSPIPIARARNRKRKNDLPQVVQDLGLALNQNGEPKTGTANTIAVLTQHDDWEGVFAFDEFTAETVKKKPMPRATVLAQGEVGQFCDDDVGALKAWFQEFVGFEPATTSIWEAVATVARQNPTHAVQEYLAGLTWDGVSRCDRFLVRYFGGDDSEYVRAIGKKWLISAVARVMQPGCQADCMLVFEGAQGKRKSTGQEALFGKAWFTDTPPQIGNKDSYQCLRGKWCIEFGELDSLRGKAITAVKNFLSAREDNYRPSYARANRSFPRQNVFSGSTNEDEYLTDRTGNRRFWPFKCGDVDVDAIREDRDQIWAEAVALYRNGETWYLDTASLASLASDAAEEREVADPWFERVRAWLNEPEEDGDFPGVRRWFDLSDGVSTVEVLTHCFRLRGAELARRELAGMVGSALRRLGWTVRQVRRDGIQVRRYYPSEPAPSGPTPNSGPPAAEPSPADKRSPAVTTTSQLSQPKEVNGCDSNSASIPLDQAPVTTVTTVTSNNQRPPVTTNHATSPGHSGKPSVTVVTVVTAAADEHKHQESLMNSPASLSQPTVTTRQLSQPPPRRKRDSWGDRKPPPSGPPYPPGHPRFDFVEWAERDDRG